MEIFRQRRIAQQNQPKHRLSLADLITDWPSLEYIEKPEYRMPEVCNLHLYDTVEITVLSIAHGWFE